MVQGIRKPMFPFYEVYMYPYFTPKIRKFALLHCKRYVQTDHTKQRVFRVGQSNGVIQIYCLLLPWQLKPQKVKNLHYSQWEL